MYCWTTTKEFVDKSSELLTESLEKYGCKEFRESVLDENLALASDWTKYYLRLNLTHADAWNRYIRLKYMLRFKGKMIEYDVDPYHTPDSKELMEAYNDIFLHSVSPDIAMERTMLADITSQFNEERRTKLAEKKTLPEKMKTHKTMAKIFNNKCGCESCNNRKRVKVVTVKQAKKIKKNIAYHAIPTSSPTTSKEWKTTYTSTLGELNQE
eukprot:Seg15547.1 transcript_id=Seg15547.1/GoldUCD/mRNA.D3Y31 product="hypothetical protein" protein_id=Seg15547.1/GoldUCD/D3Y31